MMIDTSDLKNILKKHSLIEASAGTGKTYTIVELIKIAILEEKVKPEEILVVTFTEKAKGELKDRITKKFEEIVKNKQIEKEKKSIAKKTLNEISNFEINTIHGFCNRLISLYPFEIGYQFNSIIRNNDEEIIERAFFSYLRKDIFNDFDKEEIKEILLIIGFTDEKTTNSINNILEYILKISYLFKIYKKNYSKKNIIKKIQDIKNNLNDLKNNINIFENIDKIAKIKKLKTFLNEDNNFNIYYETIKEILDLKSIEKFPILKSLMEAYYNNYTELKNELINFLSQKVFEKEKKIKLDNELISFDDMIHIVHKAITQENSQLLPLLQKKFKYGFIDEFQDTDMIQWEIFKKIFIDVNINNKLILIGDPKQSIYKFRNADINTYFNAKKEIENISHLNKNYRSILSLVDNYNKIFSYNNYFLTNTNKISYNTITSESSKYEIDNNNWLGLYFYEIIDNDSKENQRQFLNFIYKEIKNLITGKRFLIKKKEEKNFRNPSLADIAILVSSRYDAKIIQNFLIKRGISSIFYKKNLLFQSDEAIQILYLIDYLTDISNIKKFKKLLLTDFFNFLENEINLEEYIKKNNLTNIIKEFKKIINSKKPWILFQELFKILNLEKNIIQKYSLEEGKDIITTYKHIAEKLENIAYKEQLDIYSLKHRLISLINKSEIPEIGEDLYRMDSDTNKLTIITIHSSKGLEYPIVFDYGALKKPTLDKNFYYFSNDQYIFEFINRQKKEEQQQSYYEEYRRLHYVAITRAIVACYLPVTSKKINDRNNKNEDFEKLKKSSLAEFLSYILYDENFEVKNEFKNNIITQQQIEDSKETQIVDYNKQEYTNKKYELIHSEKIKEITKRFFTIQSFSSIHKREEIKEESINLNLTQITDESYKETQEEKKGLPQGKKIGSMLHKILEKINYTKNLEDEENNKIINDTVNIFFIGESNITDYITEINNLLKELFNVNLSPLNITLKDITLKDRINEFEFYFSLEDDFITGSIDLAFRYNNKYYIVDWKSNTLLPEEKCQKHFNENYKLQSEIYHYAFVKYLEKSIKEFNYNSHFGGIFFIYLRYITNDGIIYLKPDYKEYTTILNRLKKEVKKIKE